MAGRVRIWTRARRLWAVGALLVLVALLAVVGGYAYVASAKSTETAAPSFTATPANPSNSTSASFSYKDTATSGFTKFQCSRDGGPFADCGTNAGGSSSSFAVSANASHTFAVRAVYGSTTTSATSYSWSVDTTAPTATISLNGSSPTTASSVSWKVLFSEAVTGVTAAAFVLSPTLAGAGPLSLSGSGSTYTVSASTGSADGSLGLRIPAAGGIKDLAGNSLAGAPVVGPAFVIDRTPPPVPAIVSGPSGYVASTSATFSFTDGEAGATLLCRLDGVAFAACTSPTSYTGLGQGAHRFQVEARDAVGNTSSPVSQSWTVDTIPPPPPTISSKPSNPTTATSATFRFADDSDNDGDSGDGDDDDVNGAVLWCSLDGATATVCTSPLTYTGLLPGQHTFAVYAIDLAGNPSTGTTSYSWKITTPPPPPPPSITAHPAAVSTSNAASFSFTDSQAGVTYLCKLDTAASFTACASPQAYSSLTDGTHTFQVEAKDGLGQLSTPASFGWRIDTTPPNAPVVIVGPVPYPPAGWPSTNATFLFGDSSADVASYQCKLDTGPYTACSNPKTYTGLAQGQHTLLVKAVDSAGNVSTSSSAPWVFFVDTIRPNTPTLTSFPANPAPSGVATFTWTDTDPGASSLPPAGTGIAGYLCSVENGPFLPCTSPDTFTVITTNNGQHQFAVEAVDFAGNISQAASYKWKVNVGSGGQPYTISGNVSALLYPGAAAQPINLVFNSPNVDNGGTTVNQLTVSIGSVTGPNITVARPCSSVDFAIVQFGGAYPFYVPQGASSLQSLGFTSTKWPTIQLLNRPVNQDGCKGATITLNYTGTP